MPGQSTASPPTFGARPRAGVRQAGHRHARRRPAAATRCVTALSGPGLSGSVRFGAGRALRWSSADPRAVMVVARLMARIDDGRRRMREEADAGYSTETVLVTALLVVLAVAVIAIIAVKVTEKANSIDLG
jgi:hypothetical protein